MPLTASASDLQRCASLLTRDEQERAARFHFERHRRRYIVAHAALRVLLGHYLALQPAAIAFGLGPRGKPYVVNPPVPAYFNLSHSGDHAIYAISGDCECGVDIEQLDRKINHDELAHTFFSPREYAGMQKLPPAARRRMFFAYWTFKEAVIKATGDGLSVPLNAVEIAVNPEAPAQLLSLPGTRPADWTLYAVDAGSAYAAAVALYRPTLQSIPPA